MAWLVEMFVPSLDCGGSQKGDIIKVGYEDEDAWATGALFTPTYPSNVSFISLNSGYVHLVALLRSSYGTLDDFPAGESSSIF